MQTQTQIQTSNFHPAHTLFCGQAFRWQEVGGGKYSGIAHGRRLDISYADNLLTLHDVAAEEYEAIWKRYFALDADYGEIRSRLAAHGGEAMRAALDFSPGLRVMRQEPFETLITFILSQNANIPRITQMVAALCREFGEKLPCGGFAFPPAEVLAKLGAADLAPIRAGYRAPYILAAAAHAAAGRLSPGMLEEIRGVGPKVAACARLYGYGMAHIFPLDVWMLRAMKMYYPCGFPPEIADIAGIAQQFLFHYVRENPNQS
jgi:N-glycosylase/DNA lyase